MSGLRREQEVATSKWFQQYRFTAAGARCKCRGRGAAAARQASAGACCCCRTPRLPAGHPQRRDSALDHARGSPWHELNPGVKDKGPRLELCRQAANPQRASPAQLDPGGCTRTACRAAPPAAGRVRNSCGSGGWVQTGRGFDGGDSAWHAMHGCAQLARVGALRCEPRGTRQRHAEAPQRPTAGHAA